MEGLLPKSNESPDGILQSHQDGQGSWTQRLKALPLFAIHRVRRLGVGFLLKCVGVFGFLLLLLHLMEPRLGDRYRNVLSWTSTETTEGPHLRLVVFGTQDLVGSSGSSEIEQMTWPEKLCKELSCDSLLSFVPRSDAQPGILSNGLYSDALQSLQKVAEDADIMKNPAADFFFVSEQYPVPAQTPDLEHQIKQFLSLPAPAVPPQETLWVFTFGTWDIWNFAALPLESGEGLVDASTAHLFDQIEVLLKESLAPGSIAFSDFWTNATKAKIDELTAEGAAENVDARKLESFRVIIPQLFDISLTPGWNVRQEPSLPHSIADQLRNSAVLTARWNDNIRREMDSWMGKGSMRPAGIEDSQVGTRPLEPAPMKESPEKQADNEYFNEAGDDPTIYAPFPRRLGFSADIAGGILDAMTEEEMHRIGATDAVGRGSVPAEDAARFLDIWNPCVSKDGEKASCDKPADHLFYDSFTLSQRAIDLMTKKTAQGVLEKLLLREEL
ncbi:uncharacterized protein F5Z01DRAFT_646559 [Emericellopsis atlantica]|uniref:Uncharacterized protein n=1 Tax=Emericellopsis atlantica TaxID=2614577 RepID=A0A9P7ZTQ1_9HYPO|nr:uncharacterized protein F5Z01DRAFT_646559 [Emericellopsis atlantica]KAG9257632.1 hypothetical protein F5Z01DRAFT_646559 [Emericellopsis atlantica]